MNYMNRHSYFYLSRFLIKKLQNIPYANNIMNIN
jgi:hypothetical protein